MLQICLLLSMAVIVSAGQNDENTILLYRPRDISLECALSSHLRYDISFGMGLSDTITLALRTLSDDYECEIDIVGERNEQYPDVWLLVVVRFPNLVGENCLVNPKAIVILKRNLCYLLCDGLDRRDYYSKYFYTTSLSRFRFHFVSNSSINQDMNANVYEVTATSARRLQGANDTCRKMNETMCSFESETYCFTNGVICDGIMNCGTADWYDESKSECRERSEMMGVRPVIGVVSLLFCAVVIAVHVINKCIPPLVNAFFVINTNEDNKIIISTLSRSPKEKRMDYIQTSNLGRIAGSASTSSITHANSSITTLDIPNSTSQEADSNIIPESERKTKERTKMRRISERFQEKLYSVVKSTSHISTTHHV